MRRRHLVVAAFVAVMLLGGAWVGSEAPFELPGKIWAQSREALDIRADRAAIACAVIAAACLVVGLLVLRRLGRIEKELKK